jgi:hypothetical protein
MKWLAISGVFLALTASLIKAQDIPSQHQEAAQRAFAEGFAYYIWYEGVEPVTAYTISLPAMPGPIPIPGPHVTLGPTVQFRYVANSVKPARYRIQSAVSALEKTSNQPVRLSLSTDVVQPKAQSGSGSMLLSVDALLSGEGDWEIYLIEPTASSRALKSEPKHLSNTIHIHIVCKDKLPDDGVAK